MPNDDRLRKLIAKRNLAYAEYARIDKEVQHLQRAKAMEGRRYWTGKELLAGFGISISIGIALAWWLISTMPT